MMIMEIVADRHHAVQIRGSGIAACAAAHLLQRAGSPVSWEPADRPRLPAILLSEPAQALIADIFGQNNLFRDCHRVRKRVVAWGGENEVALDHSAVVVSETWLFDRLRLAVVEPGDAAWTIFTSRPPDSVEHRFGSRIATAAQVELSGEASACAIESLEQGWLFLVPDAPGSGWLLSVGGASLEHSRVIAKMVSHVAEPAGEFPAYPRILSPLGGARWLACGSAAMAFDPLCGDGTANAIREAILACAVIAAAEKGGDIESLLAHYEARLQLGFKRHLLLCRDFYRSGGRAEWWNRELAALEQGIAWCGAEPRFRYRLAGFELLTP